MWKDPIVEETRELREKYAVKHNHNTRAILKDIQQRQKKSDRKLVSFPPRKPTKTPDTA